MTRRILILVVATLAAGSVYLAARTDSVSETISQVFITNWPDVQKVEGKVQITGPVRLAGMIAFENILVSPVRPTDTTRLIDAGLLDTRGFTNVVLSLHGQVKGSVVRKGAVGAILVPNVDPIQEAFNEQGLMHFALEVASPSVSIETPLFASNQPRYQIGFEQYRVLLYNTTDKSATIDLYAYLTN